MVLLYYSLCLYNMLKITTADFIKNVLLVYTHPMTTIYLSLSVQVAESTFFMKSPVYQMSSIHTIHIYFLFNFHLSLLFSLLLPFVEVIVLTFTSSLKRQETNQVKVFKKVNKELICYVTKEAGIIWKKK